MEEAGWLPVDALERILNYLPPEEAATLGRVNRDWYAASRLNGLWRGFNKQMYLGAPPLSGTQIERFQKCHRAEMGFLKKPRVVGCLHAADVDGVVRQGGRLYRAVLAGMGEKVCDVESGNVVWRTPQAGQFGQSRLIGVSDGLAVCRLTTGSLEVHWQGGRESLEVLDAGFRVSRGQQAILEEKGLFLVGGANRILHVVDLEVGTADTIAIGEGPEVIQRLKAGVDRQGKPVVIAGLGASVDTIQGMAAIDLKTGGCSASVELEEAISNLTLIRNGAGEATAVAYLTESGAIEVRNIQTLDLLSKIECRAGHGTIMQAIQARGRAYFLIHAGDRVSIFDGDGKIIHRQNQTTSAILCQVGGGAPFLVSVKNHMLLSTHLEKLKTHIFDMRSLQMGPSRLNMEQVDGRLLLVAVGFARSWIVDPHGGEEK